MSIKEFVRTGSFLMGLADLSMSSYREIHGDFTDAQLYALWAIAFILVAIAIGQERSKE